jgi:tRNA/tmRNA/rRNA uracil-C5-methylase (TrmA/RlmC/RlmD family)
VSGVLRIRPRSSRRGGTRVDVLAGRSWIEERVAGFVFRLSATSFLQVSAAAADALADLVAEVAAPGGETALDLYCGVGVHALRLVGLGIVDSAIAVDADGAAVDCGRDVARDRGLAVRLVHADVARFLAREARAARLVVANPPRAGMGRVVATALARLGASRIVVVSCEPATGARDLAAIGAGGPYRLARVVPLDMFPQTAHVETVSVLERA